MNRELEMGKSVTEHPPGTDRRGLLRRVAAAGAVGALGATAGGVEASAAVGEPVKLGGHNAAGSTTSLSSSAPGEATLALSNRGWPPLRLGQVLGSDFGPLPGRLYVGSNSDLRLSDEASQTDRRAGWLYSERIATMTVPVGPVRVLDTRSSGGRTNIVYGGGNISSGRLRGGTTLVLKVSHLVSYGLGVRLNVTAANTTAAGFLTVWGQGELPEASSVNWWGPSQVISNHVQSQLGSWYSNGALVASDVIAIYAKVTTAVVIDVQAFIVDNPFRVATFMPDAPDAAGLRAMRSRAKTAPEHNPSDRQLILGGA